YDTPPEKVNRAVEIVREILSVPEATDAETNDSPRALAEPAATDGETEKPPHPNEAINQPDYPPRVFFNDFNPASLNILVVYWFHPPEYWDYLEHAHWINVQIMERFKAEGIDFAFPTQTLHLAGDKKRPLTVGQRWESEGEDFSHGAALAQAAALGAQTVLGNQFPASESARPEPVELFVGPLPQDDGKRPARERR
nr:mechanosensitive ion channel family protein [Gammaproteobacteria bacterium]